MGLIVIVEVNWPCAVLIAEILIWMTIVNQIMSTVSPPRAHITIPQANLKDRNTNPAVVVTEIICLKYGKGILFCPL